MAKEEIILDFKVEQGEAIKDLEQTKVAIINLKKEQKDLNDQYKKGSISTEQYAKSSVKLEGDLKKQTTAYNENLKASKGVTTQFDKLLQGLDKSSPALSSATAGINGMTKGALAFIATPLGAVIGAIGLAVGALTEYFRGSAEGQEKLTKITSVFNGVMGILKDIVIDVGRGLVAAFENPKQALNDLYEFVKQNLINRFTAFSVILDGIINLDFKKVANGFIQATTGIENGIDKASAAYEKFSDQVGKAIELGKQLGDLKNRNDVLERELVLLKGVNEERIADLKLKAEDKNLDLVTRQEALKEALRLQEQLTAKQVEFAKNKLEIAKIEHSQSESTKEDLLEEANLQAEINRIKKEGADRNKEVFTKEQQLQLEISEQERAARIASVEFEVQTEQQKADAIISIDDAKTAKIMDNANKALKASIKTSEKETAEKKKQAEIQKLVEAAKFDAVLNIFRQGQALAKEGTVLAKALGVASATVDTYKAANLALATYPPPLGGILAGVNIATGLANVTKILGITAAAGGGSFETRGPQLMVVGDNPGGRERVDVTPISGRGQTRVGGGMIQMAGGGSIVANSSSSRIDTSFGSLLKDMNLTVSWREGQELGNKVKFKEDLVTL